MQSASTLERIVAGAKSSWHLALRAANRPTVLRDEYIDWLILANAGMQHPGNVYLFDLAMRSAPSAPMLEIGSFCGLSTNIVQYLKRKHGRRELLYTCDKWIFEGSENQLPDAAPVSQADVREFVMESFQRSVRQFSPAGELPAAIEATSDEFFDKWASHETVTDVFGQTRSLGGSLGFCFIDGNHSEEYAQRDYEHCDQYLVPGGLILFDDSNDESDWDVKRVIRRIKRDGRYAVVAKNPNYLVRKER